MVPNLELKTLTKEELVALVFSHGNPILDYLKPEYDFMPRGRFSGFTFFSPDGLLHSKEDSKYAVAFDANNQRGTPYNLVGIVHLSIPHKSIPNFPVCEHVLETVDTHESYQNQGVAKALLGYLNRELTGSHIAITPERGAGKAVEIHNTVRRLMPECTLYFIPEDML
ncbi:MAG: hypothetical protein ABIG95_00775 [Candidatus Woesearchaeota archaeon]